MTQRWIETVIGRLLTDEEFRESFTDRPRQAIGEFIARGSELTGDEVAALLAIDVDLWNRVAAEIDPRLQKASLKHR